MGLKRLIFPFFDIKMPVNTIYFLKNLPLHCGFKKHRGTYIYWGSKIFPKFHAIRVRASPFFFFNLVSAPKLYIPSTIRTQMNLVILCFLSY